jgi:hypothetical protein
LCTVREDAESALMVPVAAWMGSDAVVLETALATRTRTPLMQPIVTLSPERRSLSFGDELFTAHFTVRLPRWTVTDKAERATSLPDSVTVTAFDARC